MGCVMRLLGGKIAETEQWRNNKLGPEKVVKTT
jgi:hypothetical protein